MKDLSFIVHFANDILKSFYLCPSQDYQEYYWQQPLLDALICPVSADEDPWIPENRLINFSLIVNHKFTIFSKKKYNGWVSQNSSKCQNEMWPINSIILILIEHLFMIKGGQWI